MTKTLRPLSGATLGPGQRFRQEPLVNGRQDLRRIAGPELAWIQQALGHRDEFPANVWTLGDSMTENFGVTDDYHSWVYLMTQGIQGRFRNGGIGYVPSRHAQGITWPYTSNPDGKNVWTVVSGALVDNNDYGFGLGRRDSWMGNACAVQTTHDTDRFQLHFFNFTAVFTIDVDPGTPFAQTTTFDTSTTGPALGNRVFDSFNAWGILPLGPHVIKVTAPAGGGFFDGSMPFYTDANVGVHVWNGGHSGYWAAHFNASSAITSAWADLAYQPYLPTNFADGVGNGTTTFTSASASFTDLDIGSYLIFANFAQTGTPANGMARIVARGSGTSVTLDRTCPTGTTLKFQMNRAQFTDGVTTSGLTTLTSATAAFNPWDVGCYITGPTSVPAGTYIARYNSPTSVEMSNAATASQSAQTVRFMGRQARWCAPDLIVAEFGINESKGGYDGLTESYKADLRAMVSLASERVGLGFPVGFAQRYTPSVMLLGMWAIGQTVPFVLGDLVTTSGQATVSSAGADFDPVDVGRTITTVSNTPVPAGTTILSVQDNRRATLSQNAVASSAGAAATIVSRPYQEKHWMPWRTALFELAAEKKWRPFDLYSLAGWIGATDPLNLTYDLTHPNNHGAKWISDEFGIVVDNQPRNAAVPQGIIDAKGDLILGSAADVAGKLAAGIDGQTLVYASGATLGALAMDPASAASIGQILPSSAGAGAALATGLVAPTLTATVTTVDDNEAQWLNFATSIVQFNPSGIVSPTFTITRPGRLPEFAAMIKTDPTLITLTMNVIGLVSASADTATPGNSPAAAVLGAYFRYNTIDDATAFWRTVTSDGTTRKVNTTTVAYAVNTTYRLRIVCRGVRGTSCTAVDFYINDVLVATHVANLPAVGTALGYTARIETLTTVARNLKVARLSLAGP